MTVSLPDSDPIAASYALLSYYCEESTEQVKTESLEQLLQAYPADWVRLALIEALFQGRYKLISVAQMLMAWKRRGEPLSHFSYDFATMVSHNFPRTLSMEPMNHSSHRSGWSRSEMVRSLKTSRRSSQVDDLQLPPTPAVSIELPVGGAPAGLSFEGLENSSEGTLDQGWETRTEELSPVETWPSLGDLWLARPEIAPTSADAWQRSVPLESAHSTPTSETNAEYPESPSHPSAVDMTTGYDWLTEVNPDTTLESPPPDLGSEPIHPIHEYIPNVPSEFYDRLTAIAHG
ncbi:hypothetical protein GS597_12515 [Synechococcales cyanobacterium C]|uniref:Uncharacterized protein n=1 Tax=Petrachloros mirabilis ULC683 TaxID=2781853 RepID=A0A8K2A8P6_9CYAN|nr:hypothetical protein [Petrachloros mirabilis]NCJ07315.1 hypothetical protein [Petrachloros mirabilis ULC683]